MTNTRPSILVRDDFPQEHHYRQLMLEFRRHLRARGLSDGTVQQRLVHVSVLHEAHPDLAAVTTADLETYLSRRRHTHTPEARRSMRSSWKLFYAWAAERGHIPVDPAADLAPIRVPRTVARIAPDDDVIRALRTARLPERAAIMLGRYAALRLSEIATLHMSHREGDVLRITGKGDNTRMVPINDELLDVLEQLERFRGGEGYYFPGLRGGHIHPQSLEKIIKRATGWNPHSLRHAAGTSAYEGTHDLRAVQEFLGHVSLVTTQRYVHVRAEQIRAAAAATAMRRAVGA